MVFRCKWNTTFFFFDPGPRNDQRLAGKFFAIKDTSVELTTHSCSWSVVLQMMSLDIDMKILRLWNCAGSFIMFMNFWTSSTTCNLMNLILEKYSTRISSNLRQLCPFVSKVLYCDGISLKQPNCSSKQCLMLGFDSLFQDITKNLKIHKPLLTRDW